MSDTSQPREAYAVIRLDRLHSLTAERILAEPDTFVTIKEVVPTLEEARQEVERLNELNAEKGAFYFRQPAR